MLYPHNKRYEPERNALGMPPKAVGRTGMNALTEEGGALGAGKASGP